MLKLTIRNESFFCGLKGRRKMNFSKKLLLLISVLRVLITLTLTSRDVEANEWGFKLINNSGKEIWHIYCWQSGVSGDSYTDYSGTGILKNGESVSISFEYPKKYVDLAVIFQNDKHWNWSGIALENVDTMTIDENGSLHYN